MNYTFWHEVIREDEAFEIEIEYTCTPFVNATYWQPAEGGQVEVISVKRNGANFELTDAEEAALQRACEERAGEDIAEEAANQAEWRAQCRRDDANDGGMGTMTPQIAPIGQK